MEQLLYLVGPLGCALMMAVMFGLMAKGMGARGNAAAAGDDEVAELRAEVARLRAEERQAADG